MRDSLRALTEFLQHDVREQQRRQSMLRHMRVIDFLVHMLQVPFKAPPGDSCQLRFVALV